MRQYDQKIIIVRFEMGFHIQRRTIDTTTLNSSLVVTQLASTKNKTKNIELTAIP